MILSESQYPLWILVYTLCISHYTVILVYLSGTPSKQQEKLAFWIGFERCVLAKHKNMGVGIAPIDRSRRACFRLACFRLACFRLA